LTLREEHRVRVSENMVLRRIFGRKRDHIIGVWRKVCNKKLHIFYSSPNIIRMIEPRRVKWAGYGIRVGEKKNAFMILLGKPERKRPLGRPRHG
jgi:hypothetical protein